MKQNLLTSILSFLVVSALSQNQGFERNSYYTANSNVVQILPFGENYLVNTFCWNVNGHFNQISCIDSTGAEVWSFDTENDYMGISNIVIQGDSVFYYMSFDEQCDIVLPNSIIHKCNQSGIEQDEFTFMEDYSEYLEASDYNFHFYIGLISDTEMAITSGIRISILDLNSGEFIDAVGGFDVVGGSITEFLPGSDSTIFWYGTTGLSGYNRNQYVFSSAPQSSTVSTKSVIASNGWFYSLDADITNDINYIHKKNSNFNTEQEVQIGIDYPVVIFKKLSFDETGNVCALLEDTGGIEHILKYTSDLTFISDTPLEDSQNFIGSTFLKKNNQVIIGGTNQTQAGTGSRDILKGYALDQIYEDEIFDIGVTDFELGQYYFYAYQAWPGMIYSNVYISFSVEITNFGPDTVDHFSVYFDQNLMFVMCGYSALAYPVDETLAPGESIWLQIPMTYYTHTPNSQQGDIIDLEICLSTLGPNSQLDDVPINDSYCENFELIYTEVENFDTQTMNLQFNRTSNSLQVTGFANSEIFLIDLSGKIIFAQNISSENAMIALPQLASGVYVASLKSRTTTTQHKFFID